VGRMSEILEAKDEEMDRQGNKKAIPTKENVIPCVTWDLDFEPTRLPTIPPLPDLLHTGREKLTEVTQLIQIAAFDNHIVGLTNHGHVLKYGALHDDTGVIHGRWDYVCSLVWYLITIP
jgi:SCF-associated factor 1